MLGGAFFIAYPMPNRRGCYVSGREEREGRNKTRNGGTGGFLVVSLPDAEPFLTRRRGRTRVHRELTFLTTQPGLSHVVDYSIPRLATSSKRQFGNIDGVNRSEVSTSDTLPRKPVILLLVRHPAYPVGGIPQSRLHRLYSCDH
jgi:hypothetical protein